MPDLSHRPSRYATVVVAIFAFGIAGYANADVSIGGNAALTKEQRANASLRAERAALQVKLDAASGPTCASYPDLVAALAAFDAVPPARTGWDGDKDGVACEQLKSAAAVAAAAPAPAPAPAPGGAASTQTCAAFATQEVAQKAFDASPSAHAGWDGDKDGVACEQLKPTAVAAAPSKAISTPNGSRTAPRSETPPVTAAPITAFTKAEIVGSTHHFGLYTATNEEYKGLEATLARDTTIHGYFQGFDTDFLPAAVKSAWQGGEIPLLTWESRPLNSVADETPYSLANIANGSWDAYLTKYARDITATGLPLIIRFDHEMNGTWYRWSESNADFGNAPGSYIAAWQHVHDIFEANGANQYAIWNWSPNRVDNSSGWKTLDSFYPGDAYVDWVGMTGYLRAASDTPTFSSVYSKSLTALRAVAPNKPILLSEMGATETGGHKLGLVQDFFANIATNPDVIGFVWFHYAISKKGATNDWRISSTTAVTEAVRAGLYSSEFGREQGRTPYLVPAAP